MSDAKTKIPRFVWWVWAVLLVLLALYVVRGLAKTRWG